MVTRLSLSHMSEPGANNMTGGGEGGGASQVKKVILQLEQRTAPIQRHSKVLPAKTPHTGGGRIHSNTLFSLLSNIDWAQHSVHVSPGCISGAPLAPLCLTNHPKACSFRYLVLRVSHLDRPALSLFHL